MERFKSVKVGCHGQESCSTAKEDGVAFITRQTHGHTPSIFYRKSLRKDTGKASGVRSFLTFLQRLF